MWYSIFVMEEKERIGGGYIVLIVIGILVIIAAISYLWYLDKQAAPERDAYAELAECLSERDVKFYSAFWCPNCAAQKALFKGAGKKLPHIECSLPDRSQNELCEKAEVKNYPTWEFNGNKRCTGVLSAEVLAHLSGCPLPVYNEIEYTVTYLHERLVVKGVTERLKKRGYPESDIQEAITKVTDDINAYLTENHQTKIGETEDIEHFLVAVAEVMNSCKPYEKKEESAEKAQ